MQERQAANRDARRRKYLSLGVGELVAAAVFTFVATTFAAPSLPGAQSHLALWSALGPLLATLCAGGLYWLLARQWVGRSRMPSAVAAIYRVVRVGLAVVLGLGLFGVIAWWPQEVVVAIGAVALWSFGVIEFVNYFVVRLSYPLPKWFGQVTEWRTPQLMKDLRDADERGLSPG